VTGLKASDRICCSECCSVCFSVCCRGGAVLKASDRICCSVCSSVCCRLCVADYVLYCVLCRIEGVRLNHGVFSWLCVL